MTFLPPTLLLSLLLTGPALAADSGYQSLAALRQTANEYVAGLHTGREGTAKIEVGELDARLRLAACTRKLEAFLPPGGRALGSTTVGVRCNGNSPWLVYVPVAISLFDKVVVATRPLARGAPITRDDVRLVERDLATLPFGYVLDLDKTVGKQLKQPVTAGSVLLPAQIEGPRLVRRGESVNIIARSAGLEVRMQGQAMADGAAGDWIKVRNSLTKKEVNGQITAEGLVRITL